MTLGPQRLWRFVWPNNLLYKTVAPDSLLSAFQP